MHALFSRSFLGAVFIVTCTTLLGCGSSVPPPESPTAVADAPRSGSATPDPAESAVDGEALPPASTTATSSTDDGSDIIPPFSTTTKSGKAEKREKRERSSPKKSGGKPAKRASRKSPST